MSKFFKDILTEDSNVTYCWARVASAIALFGFLAGAIYEVWAHGKFDYNAFANGSMQLLSGSGVAIAAKQFTSVKPNSSSDDEK